MKLLTRQIHANEAAKQWDELFPEDEKGVGKKLHALGEQPNPDDVASLIGTDAWTRVPLCFECGNRPSVIIEFGSYDNFESPLINLCATCLKKAFDLAEMAK